MPGPRRSGLPLASLLTALPLLLAGCDGSSTNPTEPVPISSPFAGTWQGSTAQGRSLSFTVGGTAQAPVLTGFDVTVDLDELTPGPPGVICLSASVGLALSPLSIPIVDNAFLVRVPDDLPVATNPAGITLRFEGVLQSTASASGLLMAQAPPDGLGCTGRGATSWTAQRP